MREFWIESEGVRLFAIEDGTGPVIVMLHGPMGNHQSALPLVAPLAARYRIMTPDLRGSGRSWCSKPLTFDQLADDVEALLDHAGVDRAIVGGVSGGSGIALRFALLRPRRILGLVVVKAVYAGRELGYTEHQKATFAMMDAVASRALDEGVEVLRPLYANLPANVRQKALAMMEGLDPASVVATSHFVASGEQPFLSAANLNAVEVPTLLVCGDDPLHPAEVSDLYASSIPDCTTLPASTMDVADAIGAFADRCWRAAR